MNPNGSGYFSYYEVLALDMVELTARCIES